MKNVKGFTFEQLAVILLVVLGLVITVVIAATQLSGAGSKISELGGQVKIDTIYLGTSCLAKGGFCKSTNDCASTGKTYKILDQSTPTSNENYVQDCGPTTGTITSYCCVKA